MEKENVIDFSKAKDELIKKNNKKIKSKSSLQNSNRYLQKFLKLLNKYEKDLNDNKISQIDMEELLFAFSNYINNLYKDIIVYNLGKKDKLKNAMDYAMLSGGKKIRPFLMFLSFSLFGGESIYSISPFMIAIEMIHNFSLIHDDMPCIDNDAMRRGKETVWKKYGENVALLTGDALLTTATTLLMETVMDFFNTPYGMCASVCATFIMRFTGIDGMLGGEFFDVISEGEKLDIDDIKNMYDGKTTSLINASILVGALMSLETKFDINLIGKLANDIGMAFQIKDDLFEIESDEKTIGKPIDSDEKNNKTTYVRIVGYKKAKKDLENYFIDASSIIDALTNKNNIIEAKIFKNFLKYLLNREK